MLRRSKALAENGSAQHMSDFSYSLKATEFQPKPVLRDVSVVIPTLGRPILEQTLCRILMGSAWPACLIIVEQGSDKDVAGWLTRVDDIGIRVRHILSNQRGRSAGINRGLEQVATRFVAITDDDCFVAANWLSNMAKRLRLDPDSVVTGRVEAGGENMVVTVMSRTPSIQYRPRLKFDTMSGGNMGTSMEVLRKAGLFEEDPVVATAEDAEWSYRALRKGVAIRYEPDVIVVHFGWRDTGERADQYRQYALSHGGFYGKYLRRGDLFILVRAIGHWMRALRRWIKGKLKRDTECAMIGRAYCQSLIPGILAGIHSKTEPMQLK